MTVKYPDSLSTADIASAANRKPTDGDPDRPPERQPQNNVAADNGPLLPEDFTRQCRSRWDSIQGAFVDEPRSAVQKADELVAEAIQKLAETFSGERTRLEQHWDRGDNVSTEDLRVGLQKYRSFFNRLLAV